MLVFVINHKGQPLMPCSTAKARRLLKEEKAIVVRKTPFTIKLLFGSSGYRQEVVAGMDTASKIIGAAAVSHSKVLYQSEVEIRQDVSDKYTCQSGQKCKHSRKLHVHHIVFRSEGGSDAPSNLIVLCEECHNDLHAGKFTLKAKPVRTKHATEIGMVKSALLKSGWVFEPTFGYETKFIREQLLGWEKSHAADAVAICCEQGEVMVPEPQICYKQHVAKGDYRQTSGKRSEKRLPTGKLFGLRKFDLVRTPLGVGFVKGKRSSGYFDIHTFEGKALSHSIKATKCVRLTARTTTLTKGCENCRIAV